MTGFEVYQNYCAIKAHFNGKYDFTKYQGKINVSYKSYEKRTDKAFFEKLAKKNLSYIVPFMVANFIANSNSWIGDFVINQEAEETYFEWKKRLSRIYVDAKTDFQNIKKFLKTNGLKFNDLFEYDGEKLPIIFRLLIQGYISLESYIILDNALGFKKHLDKQLEDDIIYNQWNTKIEGYQKFLHLKEGKCKSISKDVFVTNW